MNVSRLVASVGGYFVSTARDGIALHLYGGISTTVGIAGAKVHLREISNYPWSGEIAISIDPETAVVFDLNLRIPGWCKGARLTVNGEAADTDPVSGYVSLRRTWRRGDTLAHELQMPVTRVYAHPRVGMDVGRVALKRGPVVYCIEAADNPAGRVQRLRLPREAVLAAVHRGDILGGIVTLSAEALLVDEDDWTTLYRDTAPVAWPATLTAIPYYLWCNRGSGAMSVWIPEFA